VLVEVSFDVQAQAGLKETCDLSDQEGSYEKTRQGIVQKWRNQEIANGSGTTIEGG